MIAVTCFIVVGTLSAAYNETPPLHLEYTMVGALPPETNSVLFGNPALLVRPGWSLFKDWPERVETWINSDRNDLRSRALSEIWRAMPKRFVWGGSDFEPPGKGEAKGNYDERAIYWFDSSTRSIRYTLMGKAADVGVKRTFNYEGAIVFEGTITDASPACRTGNAVGEPWFVAFFGDHTVATAESRRDIEHMVSELKRYASLSPQELERLRPPPRFRMAKQTGIGPGTVMRQVPSNACCWTSPPPAIGVSSFAFTVYGLPVKPKNKGADTAMSIAIGSDTPEASMGWFKTKFFPEPPFEWTTVRKFNWRGIPKDWSGHRAYIFVKNEAEVSAMMFSQLETLFGVCFAEEQVPEPQAGDPKNP